MKTITKRMMAILLSLMVICSLFPLNVFSLEPLDPGAFDGAIITGVVDGQGYISLKAERNGSTGNSINHILAHDQIYINVLSGSCGTDETGTPISTELRDIYATDVNGNRIPVYENRNSYNPENSYYQYFFIMPNEDDVTVTAVFRAPGEPTYTHHIYTETRGKGTITLMTDDDVEAGQEVTVHCERTIDINDPDNQEFKRIIVRDMQGNILFRTMDYALHEYDYTFIMPDCDVRVTAAFAKIFEGAKYEVFTNVTGGYIMPNPHVAEENSSVNLNWYGGSSGSTDFMNKDYYLESISAVDQYGVPVPVTLDEYSSPVIVSMPPADVTVTADIREFGPFGQTYRVILDPGEGGGEPIVYESDYGRHLEKVWNFSFYYDHGPCFLLFPYFCAEGFTAPQDGYVFAGWEGNETYNNLTSTETTFTAKWEYDWSAIPNAQCSFVPGAVTLDGAGDTTFDFTAESFSGGKVLMNGNYERVEKVLACFAGSVQLSNGTSTVLATLTDTQQNGLMFTYGAQDQVNEITINVDPYAFEQAEPGVYTGNLLYSTQWYIGNELKGDTVDCYLPITLNVPEKSTVTFDACGGTVNPSQSQTKRTGTLDSLPTPTMTGYNFRGWFTQADGGEQITTDTVFTENTTVYAHWYGPSSYTLSVPNEITLTQFDEFTGFESNVTSMTLYEDEAGYKPDRLQVRFESGVLENSADSSEKLPFKLSQLPDSTLVGSTKSREWTLQDLGEAQSIYINIPSDAWNSAAPGTYYGNISYTTRWGYDVGGETVWSNDVRTESRLVSVTITPGYLIDVSASPALGGTVTGGGRFQQGETFTLTASPKENFEFGGWAVDGVHITNELTYQSQAFADHEVVAYFVPKFTVILDPGEGTGDRLVYDIAYQAEIPKKENVQPGQFYYDPNGSVGFRLPQERPDSFTAPNTDIFGGWEYAQEYSVLFSGETTFTATWKKAVPVDFRLLGDPSLVTYSLCQCEKLLDYSQSFEYWGATPLIDGRAYLNWDVGLEVKPNGEGPDNFILYTSGKSSEGHPYISGSNVRTFDANNPLYTYHTSYIGDAPVKMSLVLNPVIVTFNKNGGYYIFSDDTYEHAVSNNYPSKLHENEFYKTGYSFTGWNTEPNGSGTSYTDCQEVTFTEPVTLYAQWGKISQIKTDGNVSVYRADDNWSTTPLTEAVEGEELQIVQNYNKCQPGKYFTGEFTVNGNGLGGVVNSGYFNPVDKFIMPANEVTVGAVQEDKTAYTVDLTTNSSVEVPMRVYSELSNNYSENSTYDPDNGDMLIDLNASGTPDVRLYYEEQFDNMMLSLMPQADGARSYVTHCEDDFNVPYSTITVVLPLPDGFYLSFSGEEELLLGNRFTSDPDNQDEYLLTTVLESGDTVQVVKLENSIITERYPNEANATYTVDASHAGFVKVRFTESSKDEWLNPFGGYFSISGANDPFVGHSLTLDGDIGENFIINLNGANAEAAEVRFTWGGDPAAGIATHTNTVQVMSSKKISTNVGECFKVKLPVSAKEMKDLVTAELYVNGKKAQEDQYSVEQYALYLYQHPEEGEPDDLEKQQKLAEVCRAMLVYGAKAQLQFGYETDALADAGLASLDPPKNTLENLSSDEISGLGTITLDNAGLTPMGLEFCGASLLLNSETTMRLYFEITDATVYENTSVSLNGTNLTAKSTGSYIFYDIADISATDILKDYHVTFSNDQNSYEAIFNPGWYISETLANNDNDNLKAIVTALYRYAKAAEAYFG